MKVYAGVNHAERKANMSDHMSAAEYRRQFVDPAIKKEEEDEEFFKRLRGNAAHRDSVPRSTELVDTDIIAVSDPEYKQKKFRNHEEDDITVQVAEYCEVLLLQKKITAFSHIPQETFTKSWVTKNKNKAMGVRPGVPDMLIVFPDKVLFLELKRLKGGVVSEAQKVWHNALNAVADANGGVVFSGVAYGFDGAKTAIDNLLE